MIKKPSRLRWLYFVYYPLHWNKYSSILLGYINLPASDNLALFIFSAKKYFDMGAQDSKDERYRISTYQKDSVDYICSRDPAKYYVIRRTDQGESEECFDNARDMVAYLERHEVTRSHYAY